MVPDYYRPYLARQERKNSKEADVGSEAETADRLFIGNGGVINFLQKSPMVEDV
jgi:hypothetical protein